MVSSINLITYMLANVQFMHSQTFKSTYITVQKFGVSKICFKEINTFMR